MTWISVKHWNWLTEEHKIISSGGTEDRGYKHIIFPNNTEHICFHGFEHFSDFVGWCWGEDAYKHSFLLKVCGSSPSQEKAYCLDCA